MIPDDAPEELTAVSVEITNPETPFGAVQVSGDAQEFTSITVEVFQPDTPFGGVQVFGANQDPVQIEINTGSPVQSVFGRIGAILPICTDYDQCYAPIEAGVPEGGGPNQVLAKESGSDYHTRWVDANLTPDTPGTDMFVFGEIPTGVINGANKVFTSANTFQSNSLEVYLNGLRQRRVDDYTETTGTTFTFILAPLSGDSISIDYVEASAALTQVYGETPAGALNGVNRNFTTAFPYSPTLLAVFKDGLRLRRSDDYSETGPQTFQLVDAPLSSDSLCVDYIQP